MDADYRPTQMRRLHQCLVRIDNGILRLGVKLKRLRQADPHGLISEPLRKGVSFDQIKEVQKQIEEWTGPILEAAREAESSCAGISNLIGTFVTEPVRWETELRESLRNLRDELAALSGSHGAKTDESQIVSLGARLYAQGTQLEDGLATLEAYQASTQSTTAAEFKGNVETDISPLTLADVDALLTDFDLLRKPQRIELPQRDADLWRQAVDKAWEAQRQHTQRVAGAAMPSSGPRRGSTPPEIMQHCRNLEKQRASLEKRTGRPCTAGLNTRFDKMPLQEYRKLDPAYAIAENKAQREADEERKAIRKRLDLRLVSIRDPLMQWSELAREKGAGAAWKLYQAALGDAKHLPQVTHDLERIKAKLERYSVSQQTQQVREDVGSNSTQTEATIATRGKRNKRGRSPLTQDQIRERCDLWNRWQKAKGAGTSQADFLRDYNEENGTKLTPKDLDNAGRTARRGRKGK